ncbi:MAG: hypothetical protein N4A31_06075 [Rickettsiales bacterium]|jgi:hypothetical protein|nr:hypothetical protein [Rickettsiales bacterium]
MQEYSERPNNINQLRKKLIKVLEQKNHEDLKNIIGVSKESDVFIEVFASDKNDYSLRTLEVAFILSDREAFKLILEGASSAGVLGELLLNNEGTRFKAMTLFFAEENSFGAKDREDKSYSKEQAYLDVLEVAKEDKDFIKIYAEAAIASSRVGLEKALDTIIETVKAQGKLDEIADYKVSYNSDSELCKEITLFKYLSLQSNSLGLEKFSAAFPVIESSRIFVDQSTGSVIAGNLEEYSILELLRKHEEYLNTIDANEIALPDEVSTKSNAMFSDSCDFFSGVLLAKLVVSPGINYAEKHVNGEELPSITTYYMDNFKYSLSPKGIIQQSLAVVGFSSSFYSGNSLVDSWLTAKIVSDSVSMYDGSFNKDITKYSADLSIYIMKMMSSTIINYQFILPHYNEAKIATSCVASVIPDLVSLAGSVVYQGAAVLYESFIGDHGSN